MKIIKTVKEMTAWSNEIRSKNKTIGFVPTMGFFHEGHLSLMQEAKKKTDFVVVSVFVNPLQFGTGEDFDAYPTNIEKDLALAQNEGVNIFFNPNKSELYFKGFQTTVSLSDLPNHLCGLSRPTHFKGVTTVVTKLFNIVKPHIAVFGEKDYQQLAIIRQMVLDLNFDIEIIGHPTIREHDGLAMSSRNTNLSPLNRQSASCLSNALLKSEELIKKGEKNSKKIIENAKKFIHSYDGANVDYIIVCDPVTLEDIIEIKTKVLMAMAVKFDNTRLIDNRILIP
ncbi:MAG: pantoate--beta-alanine ligase [Desulfobacterales bacterium]|nr:pantoate--beta-alanine ligase [Desulfobacterales bacterium]